MILDQAGDLEVFVGKEIARFHQRTRSLDREVFTLPLDLEIPFRQALDRLLAVLGTLLLVRDTPMQAFQVLFGFAETNAGALPSSRPSR